VPEPEQFGAGCARTAARHGSFESYPIEGLPCFADNVIDQFVNSVRSELIDRVADRVQIDFIGEGVYERVSLKGSMSFHELS
jgi:hypothetical protein